MPCIPSKLALIGGKLAQKSNISLIIDTANLILFYNLEGELHGFY